MAPGALKVSDGGADTAAGNGAGVSPGRGDRRIRPGNLRSLDRALKGERRKCPQAWTYLPLQHRSRSGRNRGGAGARAPSPPQSGQSGQSWRHQPMRAGKHPDCPERPGRTPSMARLRWFQKRNCWDYTRWCRRKSWLRPAPRELRRPRRVGACVGLRASRNRVTGSVDFFSRPSGPYCLT